MNKYHFTINEITADKGLVKRIVAIKHSDKFRAINLLREIYPEYEYINCSVELNICDL